MVVVNTMSPCQYQEPMSIPWVHIYTMSPCLYHKSMSIPWVHVYTMSPCQFHASMSIPWVLSNNMSQCLYHESRKSNYRNKQITEIHILEKRKRIIIKTEIEITKIPKLQKYRNVNYRNTEIITERLSTIVHKYKLQKYRNTNYRNAEIQITRIKKCKWRRVT